MKDRGFTLVEAVVVAAMMAVLAAAIAPAMVQQIIDRRVDSTRAEAEVIAAAIAGVPAQSHFGFVGDIGRPPSSLQELAAPRGLPAFTTTTVRNIGMGWRGPYVNIGTSPADFLTDAFGRPYTLDGGRIRSAGPDGINGNADDIAYPPSPPATTGAVTVTVRTTVDGKTLVDPPGYRVDIYFPHHGVEAVLSDPVAPFSFTNIPMGPRAVRVIKVDEALAGAAVAEDTIIVRPGGTAVAGLWF